jgi:acyl-CoA thioester hydrolase
MNSQNISIHDYTYFYQDTVRYGDTDRQGHVNNAMFIRFFESIRTSLLYHPNHIMHDINCAFVIADIHVAFKHEIHWPGKVDMGLRLVKIGNSSLTFEEAIFQNGILCATATSVVVHISNETKKSVTLSDEKKAILKAYEKSVR